MAYTDRGDPSPSQADLGPLSCTAVAGAAAHRASLLQWSSVLEGAVLRRRRATHYRPCRRQSRKIFIVSWPGHERLERAAADDGWEKKRRRENERPVRELEDGRFRERECGSERKSERRGNDAKRRRGGPDEGRGTMEVLKCILGRFEGPLLLGEGGGALLENRKEDEEDGRPLQGRNKRPILACAPPPKHTQKSVT